jgi:uncharacterized protein (TIGR03083 family)
MSLRSQIRLSIMITDNELQAEVGATYLALAELLDSLEVERWDTPSMCEGWRVREVVAHMTMAVRYDEAAFMAELQQCEFDFTRLSNKVAARDGELSTGELVANLRDAVLHRWTPPGGGYHGALNHAVIHGLDVTVPLGEKRRTSDVAIVAVLDDLTRGGAHEHFGTDLGGRRFEADDIDWAFGDGEVLRGSAEDLALYLCGRAVAF